MIIKDITDVIEQAAPLALQESYDNAGLLVGDPAAEVRSALICVDMTESVMDEAEMLGVGLIISHHPVIFHPLRHITGGTYIERVVARAIRSGIALYACHTNLDSAPGGMSWRLGNLLGLESVILLQAQSGSPVEGAGFGIVGDLPEAMDLDEFLGYMRKELRLDVVRYSNPTGRKVHRVALCTGAGASMAGDARRAGAQVYVSSDFKYNDFLDADRDLVIADIGHFESEHCAIDLIYDIIIKKMSTFALHKSSHSVNPVNYYR